MWTTADIRTTFIDFFKRQGHTHVPSSSLVPHNDPTLLFTTAGMVQFKNLFTGQETRAYTRAASAQKCVRAGGKHNDLENVGYTARHHTFFEMLGNFSFGDYFKEEAIHYAWTLLTQEFKIDPKRLLVTVYHTDDETAALWKKIAHLPDEKIIRIKTNDNFWSAGDTGPCGPCTEIFYDHGDHIPGNPPGPNEFGDRFVEIWNLVLMQFDQQATGRVVLPKPSVDTGMGIERIAAVLQGVHDNYDTDIMKALIAASADVSHTAADGEFAVSHRVIADHLRSSSFLIADGVLPSNEGRGYVLRRIMRRAMRHAHMLGASAPHMHRLVPSLVEKMGGAYPELGRAEPLIVETLRLEEERFRETLGRGLKLLAEEKKRLPKGGTIPGDVAFRLYDTYGFPLDLTEDALRGSDWSVDLPGFDTAMAQQKEQARASWKGSGDVAQEAVWFGVRDKASATEFLGYQHDVAEAQVQALVVGGKLVPEVTTPGELFALVVNQTPFYGESGGQKGDKGVILAAPHTSVEVLDTQKQVGDLIVHMCRLQTGRLAIGDAVELCVDIQYRSGLKRHHSATHLLHKALQSHLGAHVTQKGSLVATDRLRFDFSFPRALTEEELQLIEQDVNQQILKNAAVNTRLMPLEEAQTLGAMALFGEKYEAEVRVVSMGQAEQDAYSLELCGGTHVRRTGDIGFFKIISESSVAAGVRRIEAVAGEAALSFVKVQEQVAQKIGQLLKTSFENVPMRLQELLEERKTLEKEIVALRQKALFGAGDQIKKEKVGTIELWWQELDGVPAQELKGLVDQHKKQLQDGVVVVASIEQERVSIVVGVTESLLKKFDAVVLIRELTPLVGGKGGGGRSDLAQGGGAMANALPKAYEHLKGFLTA